MINNFQLAKLPEIQFGSGVFTKSTSIIKRYGNIFLLITGKSSFLKSDNWDNFQKILNEYSLHYYHVSVVSEPSPMNINKIVDEYRSKKIKAVVAIGGGSVIDAGKAVSAMLTEVEPVESFLVGVGDKEASGTKIPFIAIPTTAGTGSEVTSNAVLSNIGEMGFKKSLRHSNFVPDFAFVDPDLIASCPNNIVAACGMDAFTQLLEAYVSFKSNMITDAFVLNGLKAIKKSIFKAYRDIRNNNQARLDMCFASLNSGIALTNTGLGIVHGFASSIGARLNIPHGVICGNLLAESTRLNIKKLESSYPESEALKKYAGIGELFSEVENETRDFYYRSLVAAIKESVRFLKIPKLSEYGLNEDLCEEIINKTSLKNNPVELGKKELLDILKTGL